MNEYRSHNCSEISLKNLNDEIILSGWIDTKRDHGNLLFVDLRDNYGITQCVIDRNHKLFESFNYYSSLDGEIISNLFSNLNSLNLFQLHNQIKNYNRLGYSSTDAKVHLNKIYSLPINLVLMTIIGSMLMLKFKFIKSRFFMLVIGVFFSVIIYYINYFSTLFGTNETVPAELSIWLPMVILVLVCFLGLIKINEK